MVKLLLPFILFGCTQNTSLKEAIDSHTLRETSVKIRFPLKDDTPPISKCSYVEEVNGRLLYFYMGAKNDVVLYDVKNKSEICRISMEFEGPNGIGNLKSFSPTGDSSIYVFSNTYTLFEIDFYGKIIHKYNFFNSDKGDIGGPTRSLNTVGGRVYEVGNELRFPTLPEGNWSILKQGFFNNFRTEVSLNKKTKKVSKLPLGYPGEYYNDGDFDVYFNRIMVNDSYVYSFASDHNVYSWKKGIGFKTFNGKSRFIISFEKYASSSIPDYLFTVIENARYKHIIYDKYRKVYYRFVYLGEELDEKLVVSSTLEEKVKYLSHLSIIIFDKQLNKIGETRLTSNKYVADNYMVLGDGLYLSINNPSNPEMSEDYLQFELLKLQNK